MEDTTGVIKSNCIYYTDDVLELYGGSQKGGGRDMGIYHLSDGTIEPHFSGESQLQPAASEDERLLAELYMYSDRRTVDFEVMCITKENIKAEVCPRKKAMLYLLYLVLMTNGNTKLSNFRMFHILPRMPEVQTNALTKESDVYSFRVLVYSFGVLLFEVLCGMVCYDEENKMEEMDPHWLKVFADIAYRCLNDRSRYDRPTAAKAVIELEAALETQKMSEGQEQLIDYELEAALLYFFRG
ncbi:zinc finger, CCHC-type containing protein, partial [Tanacetum coccineum]